MGGVCRYLKPQGEWTSSSSSGCLESYPAASALIERRARSLCEQERLNNSVSIQVHSLLLRS